MTFPVHPDELSTAWLTQALQRDVEHFEVEYFGEGAGIMGMVTRLQLRCADDGPNTVIAKFPSPVAENRAVAATYNMYGREVNFYTQLAAQIDLRVPECYYAEFNTETEEFVLLLEDLKSWRIGDQVNGCSLVEAKMVVAGIAKFHASTWQSQADIRSHNNPDQCAGMQAGFEMGWPVVCEQFADLIPADDKDLAATLPQHIPALLAEMCSEPVCVIHADVRLDNVFFGDQDIALVDWQSVCTSAPEQDLAYFVTQSLRDELRQSEDWVALYHQHLVDAGIDYDLDHCRARYRVSALYLLSYATVIAGTLDLGNARGRALGRTLFGNAMRALAELDALTLLRDAAAG